MSAPMVHRIELPDGKIATCTGAEIFDAVVISRNLDVGVPNVLSWCLTLEVARVECRRMLEIRDVAEIVELTQCDGCEEMTPADTSSGELAGAVVCERCRDLDHAEMMRRPGPPRRPSFEADVAAGRATEGGK